MQNLNQNILATIVAALNDPSKLIMSKTVFNYQFIYYSSQVCNITQKQELFVSACRFNKVDVVKLLLHYIDPSRRENEAIILAIQNNHPEVVRLLLADGRVNPADSNNREICLASNDGHLEIVRLLLADERVNQQIPTVYKLFLQTKVFFFT